MARFLITIVSWLFGIGMIGCIVVLVMTFWEDLLTIIGHGERKPASLATKVRWPPLKANQSGQWLSWLSA